jgi:hypothetical protein
VPRLLARVRAARVGDTALLLHVIPATYPTLEPALGLGGEGVFANVPDPEAEALRVRSCDDAADVPCSLRARAGQRRRSCASARSARWQMRTRRGCGQRSRRKTAHGSCVFLPVLTALSATAPRTQREAAERFINGKLEPLLKSLPGVSVRHAVLRFATDADSVGRVVCTNAEELGAAMVVIPSHGKGAQRCRKEA